MAAICRCVLKVVETGSKSIWFCFKSSITMALCSELILKWRAVHWSIPVAFTSATKSYIASLLRYFCTPSSSPVSAALKKSMLFYFFFFHQSPQVDFLSRLEFVVYPKISDPRALLDVVALFVSFPTCSSFLLSYTLPESLSTIIKGLYSSSIWPISISRASLPRNSARF